METDEWTAPAIYNHNPRVVTLMKHIRVWQVIKGMRYTDGLIGPSTWERRDIELVSLAEKLLIELEIDKQTQVGQVYHFLKEKLKNA